MKVVIGGYLKYWGPYQIAELLCFWAKPVKDEHGFKAKPEWVHQFGTWLAEDSSGNPSKLDQLCSWIYQKRKRQQYVRIDKFDSWSADHTLALIILPVLKQLQRTKHGSPLVDNCDVPEYMHRKPDLDPNEVDTWWHRRWTHVLGEMIWAFEQCVSDEEEQKFFNHPDQSLKSDLENYIKGIEIDHQGLQQHEQRKQQGLKLFGKYYQALWD